MRTVIVAAVLAFLVPSCGKSLGPGKTPRETLSHFETALKTMDIGAMYDLLSPRTRAEIDQAMIAVRNVAAAMPPGALKEAGLGDIEDMTPREIMVRSVKAARKANPEIANSLKSLTLVVLDERNYGDSASVKVSLLLNGAETTDTIQLACVNGRWYIDSGDSMRTVPGLQPDLGIQACATPT